MFNFSFKVLLNPILFVFYTAVSGAIDHYFSVSQLFINAIEKILGDFYIMTDLWANSIIIIFFGLITTFISDKTGLNDWLLEKFKPIKQDNTSFLSLREVLDYFREYNIATPSGSKNHLFTVIFTSDKKAINTELCSLLEYIKNKEITLYGQKTKTINSIRAINEYNTDFTPFYYKDNWSDDLSSVYKNKELLYTNLQINKTDLDKLIEKYKIPSRD